MTTTETPRQKDIRCWKLTQSGGMWRGFSCSKCTPTIRGEKMNLELPFKTETWPGSENAKPGRLRLGNGWGGGQESLFCLLLWHPHLPFTTFWLQLQLESTAPSSFQIQTPSSHYVATTSLFLLLQAMERKTLEEGVRCPEEMLRFPPRVKPFRNKLGKCQAKVHVSLIQAEREPTDS